MFLKINAFCHTAEGVMARDMLCEMHQKCIKVSTCQRAAEVRLDAYTADRYHNIIARGLNCATRCKKRGASLWRPFIKLVIYHTLHHVNSCKPKSDVLAQACCKKCQKWRNLRTPWRKQVLKTVTFWRNLSTSWRNLSGF